jgi:hypothetical protein
MIMKFMWKNTWITSYKNYQKSNSDGQLFSLDIKPYYKLLESE